MLDFGEAKCPKSGGDHFYEKAKFENVVNDTCVNALSRAGTISTAINIFFEPDGKACVNALSRAGTISTDQIRNHETNKLNCVNALSRAGIISTVPSGKPLFYWAREVIFA